MMRESPRGMVVLAYERSNGKAAQDKPLSTNKQTRITYICGKEEIEGERERGRLKNARAKRKTAEKTINTTPSS